MKLAYSNPAAAAPESTSADWTLVQSLIDQCRADSRLQPAGVARRLDKMFQSFAEALDAGGEECFLQARRIEETLGFLAQLRSGHAETQMLQRRLTRLLHEAFGTPEWRRPFIAGL